jgi:hypothetical protein
MTIDIHISSGLRFAILCLLLAGTGHVQGQIKTPAQGFNQIRMDPGVQDTIDKRIVDHDGMVYGSVTFRLYINDSPDLDFSSLPQNIQNLTFLGGDTLKTIGLIPLDFVGFAVQVRQYGDDPADITVFVTSNELPLRLMPGDTASRSLIVPCRTSMLTIPREPMFAEGQIISGIVELETEEFLVDDPEMPESLRMRLALAWYFRTEAFVTD